MKVLFNRQIFFIIFNILLVLGEVTSKQADLTCNSKDFFETSEVIQYSLVVNSYLKNKYIKFEVKGEQNTVNYVLSAYSDSGRTRRIQLAQGYNGKTILYLSKEQNSVYIDRIYIDLECSEKYCKGEIENKYMDSIELEEGEILNYYVSSSNTKMEFSLTSKEGTKKSNVWARGQSTITTKISHSSHEKKQNDNYYIVNDMMKNARFEVVGTEGDFINVGYIGYKEQQLKLRGDNYYLSQTNLVVDENTITGFLKKGSFDKICYQMTIRNKPYLDTVMYGIGRVLTKFALVFVTYNNGTSFTMPGEELHLKGYIYNFLNSNEMENQYLCVTFPPSNMSDNQNYKDLNELVFTYQITQGLTTKSLNIYEPQIRGESYRRIISKNTKVAFIPQTDYNFQIMYMDLVTKNGFPKLSVIECENYPLCDLNDNNLFKNAKSPQSINGISSYNYKRLLGAENYSPINKHQKLFVVECTESQKTADQNSKYFDLVCSFDSIIYNEKDKIQLIEDQIYYKFAPKDKINHYKINLQHESDINKIFIDVIKFTGEVIINTEPKDGITFDQYISVNKIYLSVKINKPSEQLDEISFSIKATSNAFYTVLFNIGRGQNAEMDSLIKNDLQSGISYLVTIDNSQMDLYGIGHKVIKIKNQRLYDYIPFMVTFYPLNCEIEGHILYNDKNNNPIEKPLYKKFGSFIHDVINPENDWYNSASYEYRLNVLKADYSDYKGKLCKVFLSAIELGTEHDRHTRDILIPDNTPQQIMFGNKVTHVSYGYTHVNHENDLIIKFNPYHKALYKIRLFFNGVESKENIIEIAAKDVIYLTPEKWSESCNDTLSICYIQLDITLQGPKGDSKEECFLEISIKSIPSQTITYIPKNVMKIDYVQNSNSQYYYTELGPNENGFIITNFLRGSGVVYSRIVTKNQTKEHSLRELMSKNDEYIQMDPFTKKADFYTFDTDCDYGCYLLLNVTTDVIARDVALNRNYPYSIIVHSHPTSGTYIDIPPIKIQVDEFIIGTVDTYEDNNRLFQFYTVYLNEDAEELIIDWQSDAGGMFIKIGNEKPTTQDYDLVIEPQGKDTIHSIPKKEFLKNRNQNFKNLVLTIGIGTNTTDSVYTTLFAFIIRLGSGKTNDIYRVNSDQKALCKTKRFSDNVFRCLYVIEYDYLSDFNNLFIYTSVQTKSAFFNLYANYINHLAYETQNFEQLKIPTKENSKFSSKDLSADYLYISEGLTNGNYLLVSVETDRETIVELMSSFNSFLNGVTPNPTTPQLFMAITNYTFSLNFPRENMVMVNLRGIGGSAEIYWENDPKHKYYLKGRDDRLSITSDKSGSGHKLLITATSNIQDGHGFVFYVTFSIRIDEANFDPLTLDRSVNYIYSSSDLPITYYIPVDYRNMSSKDSYDIFFSFSLLENEVEKNLTYYDNIPFKVTGYIVSESTIYDAKLTPDLTISSKYSHNGMYDQALRTGFINIDKNFIEESKVEGRRYLYLKIEKTNEFKNIRKYKRINVETTIMQSSSNVTVSELSYQFGYLNSLQDSREYLLRTDISFNYIILQFSGSSENINVVLKDKNFSMKQRSDKYGKKIYLIDTRVKADEKKPNTIPILIKRNNEKIKLDYMFQYINSNSTNYPYSISNTAIKVTKKANNNRMDYQIELSPVDNYKNYENITYIVRLRNSTFISKPDLTLRGDKSQTIKEFYGPKVDDGKIKLEITNCIKAKYIQVIAQIKNKEAVEYLSYDVSEKLEETSHKGKTGFIILVIIGTVLLSTIIALVIVIIIFNNKNKSLLEKVNQVSFAQDTKDDDLLITPDKIN